MPMGAPGSRLQGNLSRRSDARAGAECASVPRRPARPALLTAGAWDLGLGERSLPMPPPGPGTGRAREEENKDPQSCAISCLNVLCRLDRGRGRRCRQGGRASGAGRRASLGGACSGPGGDVGVVVQPTVPFGVRPTPPPWGPSLPGPGPRRAGSADDPSLRAHGPTGLLQPGPLRLGLPGGCGGGDGGGWRGSGSGGSGCRLLGPHLAHPGDHHGSGRAGLGGQELQGACEGCGEGERLLTGPASHLPVPTSAGLSHP